MTKSCSQTDLGLNPNGLKVLWGKVNSSGFSSSFKRAGSNSYLTWCAIDRELLLSGLSTHLPAALSATSPFYVNLPSSTSSCFPWEVPLSHYLQMRQILDYKLQRPHPCLFLSLPLSSLCYIQGYHCISIPFLGSGSRNILKAELWR
jgi:hypothetical protein